ncbi:MAG: glycosyltransferase family 4 protein [Proteobacteria bacterium]|nr:glycosyltransferase family 4 protein [Pseudomonadota bacterium]MBS0574024.1 glycosyltransferase family 4 protein [Pseudomonadota bacterium]
MSAEAPGALCLDITRLVQRTDGGPPTGIDRVERAYLAALCAARQPVHFLCRTALGWLVLDRAAGQAFLGWIGGAPLPRTGAVARLIARRRRSPGIEAALRGRAEGVLPERALSGWLRRACGGGVWLSVGHTNLTGGVLGQAAAAGLKVAVMIHDTIPLDHPEWSGPGAPERFRAALGAALRHADLILCPSRSVMAAIARHGAGAGRLPPLRAVPLGVAPAAPDPGLLPPGIDISGRFFVALGTIEPRKDHGLLLDVWRGLCAGLPAARVPRLFICGRPGWADAGLLDRLARTRASGGVVDVHSGLPDGAVGALLVGSAGLLAPSRAEGFGLPAAEAAALGVPVLASDLPVTREVLGDWPTYLPAGMVSDWSRAILSDSPAPRRPPLLSDWTAHFNCVLNFLG